MIDTRINNGWKEFFQCESEKEYFRELMAFVEDEYSNNTIYPPVENVFRAFQLTDIHDVRLVVLGQDPYHEEGEAMGLAFSVPDGVKIPPSLRNIYKEMDAEGLSDMHPVNGDLTCFATDGVLLINTVLTVREGEANSHKNKGWKTFTDNVIRYVASQDRPICYMLWGNHARSKKSLIENPKHVVLESAHPSPLSANRGFFGNNHFIQYRDFLRENY